MQYHMTLEGPAAHENAGTYLVKIELAVPARRFTPTVCRSMAPNLGIFTLPWVMLSTMPGSSRRNHTAIGLGARIANYVRGASVGA
jgi:hypothetical protein